MSAHLNPTPLLGLRYPNGAAAPCDFDEDWCVFADDIQVFFDRWQSALYRVYPAVPGALMHMTVARTVNQGELVRFDTVEFDNASMTDMDADPYTITIPRTGRWTVSGFMSQLHATSGDDQLGIFITDAAAGGVQVARDQMTDLVVNVTAYVQCETQVITLTEGARLQLGFFQSGAPPSQMIEAWMCAYWHSDAEVP